ncbi:hypothetical protein [Streptomyces rubiginosohelvolus]|uniref:hypothetical protein n=1 Tax=Streptomyces rubiginosohelvolus TaxID=67362 RepID=UPI0036D0EAB5
MVGQGQIEDGPGVPVRREVAAPVQSAQTGQHRPGEQEGVRRGQDHQASDVGALRPLAQEFHGLPAQGRGPGRVLGRVPQHRVVPVPGRGDENCGRERRTPTTPRTRRPGQRRRGQRGHRRPGLGEFAQRTGHDVVVRRVEQADQPVAYERRCQQSGVQSFAGQPQRLGLEDRVPGADEFGHETVGAARIGGGALADGPVEGLARRFRAQDRRVTEEFGSQPGDPYPGGQRGRPPVGQPGARLSRTEPGVESGEQEGLLGRRPHRVGQQACHQGELTALGVRGVRRVRALGEERQAQVPEAGDRVPDQSAEEFRWAGAGVEAPGQETGVGAVEGVADRVVRRGGHRRSVDGRFAPPPPVIRTPGIAPARPDR